MFKRIAIIFFILSLCIPGLLAQEEKATEPEIKTWKIPVYMVENLQNMVDEFNRLFDIKVASYKAELIKRFEEFKDLPPDVILDIQNGIFIDRKDYMNAIEKQKKPPEDKK